VTNRTCRSFFRLRATSGFHLFVAPVGFTASRGLNGQSCDRDYNSRKEAADAEEHQNIVDFDGHGFSPLMVADGGARAAFLQSFVGDGLGQS
jgi:hypothetical protein